MPQTKVNPQFPEEMQKVLEAISDKKVEDLVILDVSKIAGYTDYFVIGTGLNTPHIQAMATAASAAIKKTGERGFHLEGMQAGNWVLMDAGDFVLHLFQPDSRKFYALEDLWGDASLISFEEEGKPAPVRSKIASPTEKARAPKRVSPVRKPASTKAKAPVRRKKKAESD